MHTVPRPRALYIDDNLAIADSAVELLHLVGFDTRGCYDGPSALTLAQEFLPDGACSRRAADPDRRGHGDGER